LTIPWLSVNHTRQLVEQAVPMPSFALDVQRGSTPGCTKRDASDYQIKSKSVVPFTLAPCE
jgi:hypothetical protein